MSKTLSDDEWAQKAHEIALEIVTTVSWPWTERQKRLWFIGVLAGMVNRKSLEEATMEQLQEFHREITK